MAKIQIQVELRNDTASADALRNLFIASEQLGANIAITDTPFGMWQIFAGLGGLHPVDGVDTPATETAEELAADPVIADTPAALVAPAAPAPVKRRGRPPANAAASAPAAPSPAAAAPPAPVSNGAATGETSPGGMSFDTFCIEIRKLLSKNPAEGYKIMKKLGYASAAQVPADKYEATLAEANAATQPASEHAPQVQDFFGG